jgi:general secretion pathway protein D
VKTTLLILFLTAFGLAAQIPPFPSPRTNALPDAARAAMLTNSTEYLRQQMRRALANGTNAVARANAAIPTNTLAAPVLSVPPVAVTNAPPPSAAVPANLAGPQGVLTPSNAPATTLPAVTTPPARPAAAPAAAAKSSLEEPLQPGMIDFRSADLNQVLDIYSMMVNRTILRPATLPAPTITLTTHGQLTVGEGIQALEAVLGLNGITMVNMGDKFVKAMPEAQGNTAGARFDTNSAAHLPDMGQYITHVVQLKYAKPSEMVPVLTPFIKIPNAILPIDSSQILVLRDYTENVKRMLELIKDIDVAVPSEFVSEVIPIKYAKATEIASALNSLSSGGGGASVGGGTSTGTSTRSTRSSGMGRTGGMSGYPGQGTMPGMLNQGGATGTTPTAQPGGSFSQRLQNIIQRASASGEIQVLGQTKIISDERTNSLLIYASKDDMKIIKDIVAKLDVVLAQVLIEAVIIEVALKNSRDLGIAAYEQKAHPGSGYFQGLGALNNGSSFASSPLISSATNVATTLPGGFSYLASFGQDLDVTVSAVANDSRARILQRPRIQTSHNEPASLFVGESRPYPTSSYYGGGGYGGYSSIQQMQIGVTLEVTPLINPDGLVVMDIHQKIDSVSGTVNIANVGDVPITSSKEASAKVSVRDHDTIILGGLIETDKNKTASGVPLLMDIPVLGYLFRNSHNDENRSELIVLIRPTVLPTPEIAALAATAEKNKMPGVRDTEREIRAEETRRLKQADSAEKGSSSQPVAKP